MDSLAALGQRLPSLLEGTLVPLAQGAQDTRGTLNQHLATYEPLLLMALTALCTIVFGHLADRVAHAAKDIRCDGLKAYLIRAGISTLMAVPMVRRLKEKELGKVMQKLSSQHAPRDNRVVALPPKGLTAQQVVSRLSELQSKEPPWKGRCSGTVYMGDLKSKKYDSHMKLLSQAYSMFAHTNPLHADRFPAVKVMEAEVVAMVADFVGGNVDETDVCGNVTTGGSESLLMAVKATRDYMKATRGIHQPELVMCESAHSAFDKACSYFNIRLVRTRAKRNGTADVDAMRAAISENTIMLVASAPGYPHGVLDPVEQIATLALEAGVCLHVDCCLGGFVLPFARNHLKCDIGAFDFTVPGVTSMSVDTHKYGLASKGSSVVLFKNKTIRGYMFTACTEWSGGLYISPTMTGSRAGGSIAAAWAALLHVGLDGYVEATDTLLKCKDELVSGIPKIRSLYIVGKPVSTVVAFGSRRYDIFKVRFGG